MSMAPSLPDDLLVEILARLPACSIGRVHAVCRAWRAATTHPSFDRALAGRPQGVAKVTSDARMFGNGLSFGSTFNFDLFHGRWHRSNSARKDVAGPPRRAVFTLFSACKVHGSWDGILCLQPARLLQAAAAAEYVLWNPLTEAFATVPGPACGGGRLIGGYAHPVTRRFHLLHCSDEPVPGGDLVALVTFRILRVGDDAGWRELPPLQDQYGRSPSILIRSGHDRPVSAHGNLHWLVMQRETRKVTLLVFDTARERFRLTAAPDVPGLRLETARAVVSRGELCVLALTPADRHLEMWVLVDDDDHSGGGPRWRMREETIRLDGADLLPAFVEAAAVEGADEGDEIFIRLGDRIDAYNARKDVWRKVSVAKDAPLLMDRTSVLPPEVSFGTAAEALVPRRDRLW